MPDEEKKPEEKPAGVTPQPVVVTETPVTSNPNHSSAGHLVLQWLTYAFWGWLILALVWLMGVVLTNAILNNPDMDAIPYAIASSLVLLPLAFFTDRFYARREPVKKVGPEAILMVIHAVLFAIFGIIALIVTVFTAISVTVTVSGASEGDAKLVGLLIAGFATLLYAAIFLRTLNPFQNKKPVRIYSLAMLAITVLLLIFAFAGPLAKSFATRNDRLIEQSLSSVERSISTYIQDNEKLPDTLTDITPHNEEAETLIDNNLVEYKKEKSVTKKNILGTSASTEYRYQLCVEYSQASKDDGNSYPMRYQIDNKEYQEYVSTSHHDAGEECYKLQTTITTANDDDFNVDILNL